MPLDFDDFFLGIENLGFIFLQLWRRETLVIHECLLAFIVGGSEMEVCLGNFQVVSKNRIELPLQGSNSGALPFPQLDLRQVLLAIATEVAQVIQFLVDAVLDYSAIAERNRRLRNSGALDMGPQVSQFVHGPVQRVQPRSRQPVQGGANRRNLRQRSSEC